MNDKLKQAEELCRSMISNAHMNGSTFYDEALNHKKQLLSLISQLVEENEEMEELREGVVNLKRDLVFMMDDRKRLREENEKLKQRVIDLQGHSNLGAVLTNSTITGDGGA